MIFWRTTVCLCVCVEGTLFLEGLPKAGINIVLTGANSVFKIEPGPRNLEKVAEQRKRVRDRELVKITHTRREGKKAWGWEGHQENKTLQTLPSKLPWWGGEWGSAEWKGGSNRGSCKQRSWHSIGGVWLFIHIVPLKQDEKRFDQYEE